MKSLLHITNGDGFTKKLKTLPIKGDIITWREMLCEGKTLSNVGSETFWKTRFEFLNKNYKITKSWFVEKTLKEYRSLCNHKAQNEIVLWFEYDLFCQINMLAVISWLKTHRRHAEISLVCSGKEEGSENMFYLNQLSDERLLELYENKITLSQDDIEYADYVWQLYCSDNPIRLENLKDFADYKFDYLSQAVQAHLQRFPYIKNGLNHLENEILQVAINEKPRSKKALMVNSMEKLHLYGYGDTQFDRLMEKVKPLFKSMSPAKLTTKGLEVASFKTNYYSHFRDSEDYLGGALKYNFLYNTESSRILKL